MLANGFEEAISGKFDQEFGVLHAMFYSFLQPFAASLTDERVKKHLSDLQSNFSLNSFEEFQKLKKIVITAEKKSKDVQFDDNKAKLVRLNKGEKILPK
jgi:hypothetical protein